MHSYKPEQIVFCNKDDICQYIDCSNVLICGSKFFIDIKDCHTISIPDGEEAKSMEVVKILWDMFTKFNIDKHSLVISVGGGSVSDVVGFAASTYMRGVPYASVPTTLLSMIDASIGGKRGINLGCAKNLIGTFYNADSVYIDMNFLDSLSDDELKNGYIEAIKMSAIKGQELPNNLEDMVKTCIKWKQEIVSQDYFDNSNIRASLNFGHSLAHGIEAYSNYEVSHGIAVALGMDFACFCFQDTEAKQFLDNAFKNYDIYNDIYSLKTTISADKAEDIVNLIFNDKKKDGDKLNFVHMQNLGCPKISEISFDTLKVSLVEYLKNN